MGSSASPPATGNHPKRTGESKSLISEVKKIIEKSLTKRADKTYSSPTQKFSRGRKIDAKSLSYEEVATIYVWHEKNFAKLPKWMTGTGMATGHAAMKLSRFNPDKGKNLQLEYISWWPGRVTH